MKKVILRRLFAIQCIAIFAMAGFSQTNWSVKTTKNSSLAFNVVSTLYQDLEGNIWVGTKNGLNRINGDQWDTYTKSSGLPHKSVTDICEDTKGNIWVATFKGLGKFSGGKWSYIQKSEGLINNKVFTVETDSKGRIWVGTKKGVSVFDGKDRKDYTTENGLINNWVTDIMEDNNGNIWFATKTGVSVFDGQNWKSFSKKDGMAMNYVGSMAQNSDGKIWFGALNGSFSSYNGSDWESIKKGSGYYNTAYILIAVIDGVAFTLVLGPVAGVVTFVAFAALGALPSQPVLVYIDSGDKTWLATQPKGIYMFDGKNWMHYSTKNGLPHNRVTTILESKDGSMWFGTSKGIAILKHKS